jgi:hypothetical protein
MINNIKYALLIVFLLCSCRKNYESQQLAEWYCQCMKDNRASTMYESAAKLCDSEFVSKNRYMRLWTVDMRDDELDKNISDHTRDSVKTFIREFTKHTRTHCCKETLGCTESP